MWRNVTTFARHFCGLLSVRLIYGSIVLNMSISMLMLVIFAHCSHSIVFVTGVLKVVFGIDSIVV